MASLFQETTTYDPIFCLLNADSKHDRDELTQKWKNNKVQELNFIGIVGGLLAGVLTSTGSWPRILPNGVDTPWTVRACWFSGLILALTAVITAAQQAIRLYRLSSHPQENACIRRLLSSQQCGRNGKILPRRMQVYAWQMSGFFLTLSALFMLFGMLIMVWNSTGYVPGEDWRGWWNGEAKMAVTFTTVSGVAVTLFIIQQWTLHSWNGGDDADQADHGGEGNRDSPSRAFGPVDGPSTGGSPLLPNPKNHKYGTSS